MSRLRKITIVGVGLMGGSIGRAVRKKKLADKVVGFFRQPKKISEAIRLGCVDVGTDSLNKAVKGADLIILCSPVDDIIKKLHILKSFVPVNTLITDAGSTKSDIIKASRGLNFIGSHPLAGSEQSGLRFATPDLLEKALCVLTPPKDYKKNSLASIARFWHALGARTVVMGPEEHDAALSFSSHLPHAAAYALIQSVPKKFFSFAAGGLKDTTRIAHSNPEVWSAIFLSNRKNLLNALTSFEKSLRECRDAISRDDKNKLLRWLKRAQHQRITAFNE